MHFRHTKDGFQCFLFYISWFMMKKRNTFWFTFSCSTLTLKGLQFASQGWSFYLWSVMHQEEPTISHHKIHHHTRSGVDKGGKRVWTQTLLCSIHHGLLNVPVHSLQCIEPTWQTLHTGEKKKILNIWTVNWTIHSMESVQHKKQFKKHHWEDNKFSPQHIYHTVHRIKKINISRKMFQVTKSVQTKTPSKHGYFCTIA